MKDNTKDQQILYEYEVKAPPPTDNPNTPSQNHDYPNSTPEEQICNIKVGLVALKSFVIEQIYVLKKRLEGKKVSAEVSNLLKLLQEQISYLREENKVKSEIMRILSEKQNTYRCLHTNTTDTANTTNTTVPEMQTIDQDTIRTKSANTDISDSKKGRSSQDGN